MRPPYTLTGLRTKLSETKLASQGTDTAGAWCPHQQSFGHCHIGDTVARLIGLIRHVLLS